jgi:hypothetical protein
MGNYYVCGPNPDFFYFITLMYYANSAVCIATDYEPEGHSSISWSGKNYLIFTA